MCSSCQHEGSPSGQDGGGPPGIRREAGHPLGKRGFGGQPSRRPPGFGRLVTDDHRILTTVHSRVATLSFSRWAAKWASNLDAWHLAASLGIPLSEVRHAARDCV